MKTVLCADIGTTSIKAGLFTADGEAVFLCRKSFPQPDDRYVAREWMRALTSAMEKLNQEQKASIEGLCISGAGPTVVLDDGLTFRWNEALNGGQSGEVKVQSPRGEVQSTQAAVPSSAARSASRRAMSMKCAAKSAIVIRKPFPRWRMSVPQSRPARFRAAWRGTRIHGL